MTWVFESLGTRWEVDASLDDRGRASVAALLEDYDRTWSRFRADAEVAELARSGGAIELTAATSALFDLYDVLHDVTAGAVSPLVGASLVALGYDADHSLRAGPPVPAAPWPGVRRTATRLVLDQPGTIDIGAAGKGLAVDLVVDHLARRGAEVRSVDASGDLWHADLRRPLRVALEDPDDPRLAIGVVELEPGTALCSSAINRRAWGDQLHHVVDARIGLPVHDVIASWAIGPSTMVADGAATALFFAPPAEVLGALDVHAAVRVLRDRRIEVAGDLPGEVFT